MAGYAARGGVYGFGYFLGVRVFEALKPQLGHNQAESMPISTKYPAARNVDHAMRHCGHGIAETVLVHVSEEVWAVH